jgi:hypothetical protein
VGGFQGGVIVGPAGVLTSEVTPKHEVEDEETVLVVLEGIPHVDDERVIDLNRV